MERFHIIDEAEVITVTRSVFKQSKVYRRGSALYFGYGGGYVRLYSGHNTGLPNVRWEDIEIPGVNSVVDMESDPHGKLSLSKASVKLIEGSANK